MHVRTSIENAALPVLQNAEIW